MRGKGGERLTSSHVIEFYSGSMPSFARSTVGPLTVSTRQVLAAMRARLQLESSTWFQCWPCSNQNGMSKPEKGSNIS